MLVLVLRDDTVRIQLDDPEREAVTVHDPSVDAVPDPLKIQ